MSSRERRTTLQPKSYKVFSETGETETEHYDTDEILDYVDEHDKDSQACNDTVNEDELLGMAVGGEPPAPKSHSHTGSDKPEKESISISQITNNDDAIDLHANDEEMDAITSAQKPASPSKKGKLPKETKNSKKKNLVTPVLANDEIYNEQCLIVEREREAAKQMLLHQEREAKLVHDKMQAAEDKKRARQLELKTKKANKKLQQDKQRYEKQILKEENKITKTKAELSKQDDVESWLNSPINSENMLQFLDTQGEIEGTEDDNKERLPFMLPPRDKDKYLTIANELADDDKVSICRDTGIYRNRSRTPSPVRMKTSRRSARTRSSPPQRSTASITSRRSRVRSTVKKQSNRYDREQPWDLNYDRSQSPSRRRDRSGETIISWQSNSDSEEAVRTKHRKIKSGINAKPGSKVKQELTYPHFSLGQLSSFMGANLTFHTLSYEQFLAGELETIVMSDSNVEKKGRILLLRKIAHWKLQTNATWQQIRNTYAMIVRKIENCEITWEHNFDLFERHIYEKVQIKTEKTAKSKAEWFCKQYQKPEGCNKDPPHLMKIGTTLKMVHHFCAACWIKDKSKRLHSESSNECPSRNNEN